MALRAVPDLPRDASKSAINSVQYIISRIGQRFSGQGRKKTEPVAPSLDSSEL